MKDSYLQHEAEIIDRTQDTLNVFTIGLQFTDPEVQKSYVFQPGQFNMLYLYGVGEVAISIVYEREDKAVFSHTIHAVGRVTKGMAKLKVGDRLGVRGPFGRGWPMEEAKGKDVVIVTGGVGCAPVVGAINYVLQHRDQYRKLIVMQGVKHSEEFFYQERYKRWKNSPNMEIFVSASRGHGPEWPWQSGRITNYVEGLDIDPKNVITMVCGPEGLMRTAALEFVKKGLSEKDIYLSMERNMHCGVGHCGHCQLGGVFICKDGPIFQYAEIKDILGIKGL